MSDKSIARGAAAACLILIGVSAASADTVQDKWQAVVAKAKGQTMVITHQPNQSVDLILDDFAKKFDIKIEATADRPSQSFIKLQTEQKNEQFVWDIWWGGSSNMVFNAAPNGMLEKIEPYLFLPEVTDISQWRHADFIYGDSGHHVFTFLNYLDFGMLRNASVVPDLKIDTLDALLDPRLKGKIAMRDASEPNFSTDMLATIVKQKGGDFLRQFLTQQDPKIYSNQQLLLTDITRGGQALAIGLDGPIWEQCRQDGGCKTIDPIEKFAIALSWGISVPKNPPHPDVVKLWLNWFLSREGQQSLVTNWIKYNNAGAVSMRKDVTPPADQLDRLPDFTHPEQYAFIASEKGEEEVTTAIKIFRDVTRH